MFFDHDFKRFPELSNTQLEVLRFVSPHVQYEEDFDAVVVKVHDADTVTLRSRDRDFEFPLRLANIDAPELNNGGKEAGDYLRSIVEGKSVRILIDRRNRVGKYGRLIGEVLYEGRVLNDDLVRLGFASVFGKKLETSVPKFDRYIKEVAF